MSGVAVNRRAVLGAMAVLPGLAMAPRAQAAAGFHFILDALLPEAAAIRARADAAGHPCAHPAGEIIRLLLSEEGHQMAGTIIGLTTYSDYVLARDMLRMRGRRMRAPHALPAAMSATLCWPLCAKPARAAAPRRPPPSSGWPERPPTQGIPKCPNWNSTISSWAPDRRAACWPTG